MNSAANGGRAEVTYKDKTFIFEDGKTDVICGKDTYRIPVAPYVKNGVLYVPLNAAAYIAGLNYVQNEAGTAIITESSTENALPALEDLYGEY
jgi:hypothetical protein